MKPGFEKNKGNDNKSTQGGGFNDIKQVINTCVTPHTAVKIEKIKTDNFGYHNNGQHLIEQLPILIVDVEIKSYQVGSI